MNVKMVQAAGGPPNADPVERAAAGQFRGKSVVIGFDPSVTDARLVADAVVRLVSRFEHLGRSEGELITAVRRLVGAFCLDVERSRGAEDAIEFMVSLRPRTDL